MAAAQPIGIPNTIDRERERELGAMKKSELVALVLEHEAKVEELEKDNDVLRDMVSADERAVVLHVRLCELGFAEGPLHVQTSDYTACLARAIRRT